MFWPGLLPFNICNELGPTLLTALREPGDDVVLWTATVVVILADAAGECVSFPPVNATVLDVPDAESRPNQFLGAEVGASIAAEVGA